MSIPFGFSIKSKSDAMPSSVLKYFTLSVDTDSDASALADVITSCLANNAKISLRKILTNPGEQDYELADGVDPIDEEYVQFRLLAEYQHNGKSYTSSTTCRIPCINPSKLDTLSDSFKDKVKLKGVDNADHAVTDVQITSRRTYKL